MTTEDEELRAFARALYRTAEPEDETDLSDEQKFVRSLFRNSN